MERSEFERDIRIDPDALDVECTRQPELFLKWAERSVKARGEVDRLKLALEVVEAQLELACRKDPETFGLEGRTTEGAIKAAVALHDDYLTAQRAYMTARDDSAMLDKAVAAMEMKKRMLETLVTLHGQSYFAGPATPRDLKAAYMAQRKAADEQFNKKQIKIARKRKRTK